MTEERKNRFQEVLGHRQSNLAVVLENVHDQHNISAVLRSADAVGVQHVYVIHQFDSLKWDIGKNSSASAYKWLTLHLFDNVAECMSMVKKRYGNILGTHLKQPGKNLFGMDFDRDCALVFGNEREGISEEMNGYIDENFHIPMMGMTKSLNISVACAVSLYEACRQRLTTGQYHNPTLSDQEIETLYGNWIERDFRKRP